MLEQHVVQARQPRQDFDYSQKNLIDKLQVYLNAKKAKKTNLADRSEYILAFDSQNGWCAGLVSYWLYCKATNSEDKFIDAIESALTFDFNEFLNQQNAEVAVLEELLNTVSFLEFEVELRDNIRPYHLNTSFKLLLGECSPQVREHEFKITFLFNQWMLADILNKAVHANKMVRISNKLHVIGLMYNAGIYYLYDPSTKSGPQQFTDVANLAAAIFKGLDYTKSDARYLALNLMVYDIDRVEPVTIEYPDVVEYYKKHIKESAYKDILFKDSYLLKIACLMNDFVVLDLLFANGYIYIPSDHGFYNELDDAIFYKDRVLMDYLLAHAVPLDYKGKKGITALGAAIQEKNQEALFKLLCAGADPNVLAVGKYSTLNLAITYSNAEACILLLAFGFKILGKDKRALQESFVPETLNLIYESARVLNLKLQHLPETLNLNSAAPNAVVAFLQHAKILSRLGISLNKIALESDGEIFYGKKAINVIARYCQQMPLRNLYDYTLKIQLLALLYHFGGLNAELSCPMQILELLRKIPELLQADSNFRIASAEFAEIDIIINAMAEIKSKALHLNPVRLYLWYKAISLKDDLVSLVKAHNLSVDMPHTPALLFFANPQPQGIQSAAFEDFTPLLKLNS